MSTKHPSGDLLASYATGHVTDGVALAVAAHLTYCAKCRHVVAAQEAVAGALLAAEEAEGAVEVGSVMARLDEPEPAPEPKDAPLSAGPLPLPVAAAIGRNFDDIPWRFKLPGVSAFDFQSEDGETVSLLKVRPGTRIPQHTHNVEELTVVFAGELVDGDKRYCVGDMAIADDSVDHHPSAGGTETCICLAVVNGGLRFTGPLGRALNLFS